MRGHGWPLAALAALVIAPARADAVTTVVLLHESAARGGADVYHPGNALITSGYRDAQSVGVGINQGSTHLSLDFWAPPGQAIGPGTYPDAFSENPTGTRPGFFYDGDDCTYSSEFEIKDLAIAPGGIV